MSDWLWDNVLIPFVTNVSGWVVAGVALLFYPGIRMGIVPLVDQAELNDHGVILEYQLGNTSRRLDAMLTGHAATSAGDAVVVELKQWSEGSIGPSTADNCVELSVGKQVRRVLHPSVQVGGYQQWLLDNHSVFYETDAVALTAVSFLHNLSIDATTGGAR